MEIPGEAETAGAGLVLPNEHRSVSLARRAVSEQLEGMGLADLTTTTELVVTELVTNAVLHTDGPVRVELRPSDGGVRVSVFDTSSALPVVPLASSESMTGRGLLLVRGLSARFGFARVAEGKVVWAELRDERLPGDADIGSLIDAWADDWDFPPEPDPPGRATPRVELGDVPTDLLLAAKAHVDNLVREFTLAAAGAASGTTAAVPAHLAALIEAVVSRFADARLAIKRQALEAARRGVDHVRLVLDVGRETAEAGEEYLRALDEADAYCRAARLLTLATPPKHRVFRHWYVGELILQLRRSDAGLPPTPSQPFEDRLLEEIDQVAAARAVAERAARLFTVSSALSSATTPEAVAEAVLSEGVAALGASGGGLLLPADGDRLAVPGTVGYDDSVVASLRAESPAAELPAAVALRTGTPVWIESREERDARFPELVDMERRTISMCAVPLEITGRRLGALRFSFTEPRLFDHDERRFVLALGAQAAQALDRAQLSHERAEVSRRLQRSLLPPALPDIPGVDLAALYHPLGDGLEVGGDFYDVWRLADDRWALAIGDVCGTGPEAAAYSALVRHTLRAVTSVDPDPTEALHHLNRILLDSAQRDADRFSTAILGTVEVHPQGHRVRLVTGGHPEPVVRRAGRHVEVVATGGSLLGVLPEVDFVTQDLTLAPGDSLVLYTDGVTEARSGGRMFDTDGLLRTVEGADRRAGAMAEAIQSAVLAHSGGTLHDDMAVLVVHARAAG